MNGKPTRRNFFGQAGAALAAPLAATTAFAADDHGDLAARLARLEDIDAIRALLPTLLTNPSRLGLDGHVLGITADRDDAITVASDGTATARLTCSVETATPIESCGTLVEMARLQGEGIVKRTDRRVLHSRFVKQAGVWQLESAELRT